MNFAPPPTKTVLSSGVRVLLDPMPHVHSCAVGLWVDTGSDQEDERTNGVCHFLEHMLFKGTATRDALAIARSLEAYGGQLNAFTDKENTCFHAKVLSTEVPLALEVLSDMLLNSLLDARELRREREVVIEEIKMYDDTPDDLVHELLAATLWEGHPLGRPVTGTRQSVRRFDRALVEDFWLGCYTPDRVVVSLAGGFDEGAVLEQLERLFAGFKRPSRERQQQTLVPRAGSKVRYRDVEQAHLVLAVPGVDVDDPRRYTQALLDNVLGDGMSSRLFQEVREKRGLVYSIASYEALHRPGGLFAVNAGMSPKHLPTVLDVVYAELAKVAAGEVGEEELEGAKRQLRGSLLLSLEVPRHRMSRAAENELYHGRHISPQEVLDALARVTPEDLRGLAATLFAPGRFTTTVVGPLRKLPARYA